MAARILRTARRLLPWLAGWLAFQGVVALAGRLLAARFDEGDDSSKEIRRVLTMGGLELTPTNPAVSRIEVDLGMAGGEIDLTGLRETSGIDLTVRAVMGGLAVRVPPDWRVWSHFLGVGGLGTDGGVQRTSDEHAADLRVHGRALFGGIGVEAG
jgi:hypothetical protein